MRENKQSAVTVIIPWRSINDFKLGVLISEVLPGPYFWEEGVSRAAGVVHHLSVAMEGEVSNQSPSIYCTSD